MVTIKFIDPVRAECSDIHAIKDCLKYPSHHWKQGPYNKVKEERESYLCKHDVRRAKGTLLTGLLPRVKEYCQRNGIELEIIPLPDDFSLGEPCLPGIVFREDQSRNLNAVKIHRQGVIKSPTGSGKTVMAGGVISMAPKSKAVFIVHTKSLFTQSIEEFKKWFGTVGTIGDEQFSIERVNVIMIQTARNLLSNKKESSTKLTSEELLANKLALEELLADADIMITDEAHHITEEDGQYAIVFKNCLAPIRIGFTATTAKGKAGLVCEGYLGPIIGELTMEEGIKKKIIAQPRVKLIPVPISPAIASIRHYKDLIKKNEEGEYVTVDGVYTAGIIKNRQRNRLIAKEISFQNSQGLSVLVMIKDVVGGQAEMIKSFAEEIYNTPVKIVQGNTPGKIREKIKEELKLKQAMGVIATDAWREGLNIPSLDCVINGGGYKAEIMTLQGPGRGLRTTETKRFLLLVDFLDPYDFLAQHAIQRIKIYVENGWM